LVSAHDRIVAHEYVNTVGSDRGLIQFYAVCRRCGESRLPDGKQR
jgi:hypothetical protein